jgi:hypothetical protein
MKGGDVMTKYVNRTLMMNRTLYNKLQKLAKRKCLTIMALIRMILAEYFEDLIESEKSEKEE